MRRTLVAGLFLATVAASGTAQAGWQKTKWGMTPEQVEAIYGKSLRPLSSDDQESAKHLSDTHVPYRMSYAAEDFHFDVRFAFDPSDRLAAVYLFDTPPSCAPLTKALLAKYGNPAVDRSNDVGADYTWLDRASSNTVHLQTTEAATTHLHEAHDVCMLVYTPLASGKGL
jgi:hypothetical protein